MTVKRFTVDDGLENVLCWEINDKENVDMTCGECAKLLNDLSEENEQLKSEKKDMQILINTISDQRNEFHRGLRENANRVGKLEKENEKLKSKNRGLQSELQIFKEDVTHSNQIINKLNDENEQLRARNKYLERKIQRERNIHVKEHEKWEKEIQKENEQLKQQCKDFIEMLDDMCVAYLINDGLEEILND